MARTLRRRVVVAHLRGVPMEHPAKKSAHGRPETPGPPVANDGNCATAVLLQPAIQTRRPFAMLLTRCARTSGQARRLSLACCLPTAGSYPSGHPGMPEPIRTIHRLPALPET